MSEAKKAIILDCDGVVILGSNELLREVIDDTLEEINARVNPAAKDVIIEERWGIGFDDLLRELLSGHPRLISRAIKSFKERVEEALATGPIRTPQGVPALLEEAAADSSIALFINTASPRHALETIAMPRFGIDPEWFDEIVCAEDFPPHQTKPAPDTIFHILRTHDLSATNAIMVGDSTNDVQAALMSGIEPAVVLTGNIHEDELDEVVDFSVRPENIFPNVNEFLLKHALGRTSMHSTIRPLLI